jgi:hypothetical protein
MIKRDEICRATFSSNLTKLKIRYFLRNEENTSGLEKNWKTGLTYQRWTFRDIFMKGDLLISVVI